MTPTTTPSLWRRELRIGWPAREDRAALLGLAGLVVLLLREAVFEGRVFYLRDIHLQWYGQVESFVRAVTSGSWPVWDPFVSFGQPLLANANTQVLYPPTWMNLVMRPWTYYTVFLVAHLTLAAAGLYFLARRCGISPMGSFVAAATWANSGPVLSLGNLWNHLAAAAWLPWVLLAAEVALDSGRLRDVLLWGATMAAQVLAGSPDVFVMTAVLVGADAARHVSWRRPWERSNRRVVASLVLSVGFALALSAGQWLPSLDLAARAGRFHLSAEHRGYWSLHPLALLQAMVPIFWNDLPLRSEYREALFESREPLLLSVYLGLPSLGFVLAAFAGSRRPMRTLLGLGAAGAALLALGRNTPAYGLAMTVLPMLRVLRFPSKAMVLVAFCCALLAGMGVDAWREPVACGRRRWFALVGVPLAASAVLLGFSAYEATTHADLWGPLFLDPPGPASSFAALLAPSAAKLGRCAALAAGVALLGLLRQTRPAASWGALAVGVVAIAELAVVHQGLNPTAPREFYTLHPGALEWVRQDDHRRLYVVDYQAERGLSERALKRAVPYIVVTDRTDAPQWAGALGARIYPVPPVAAAWGVFDSYSRDPLGIRPPEIAMLSALLVRTEGTPLYLRLLRVGAVSRVMALHTKGLEDLVPVAAIPGPFLEPLRVFRVPAPLPRAYCVGRVRQAAGPGALEALGDPGFDPDREVILPQGRTQHPAATFSGAVDIVDFRADRVRLDATLEGDGYVVLVDTYDPGWRASVDGSEAPVLRANLAFRAVPVPSGRHVVELVYRPLSVTAGLLLSVATLAASALLVFRAASPTADA